MARVNQRQRRGGKRENQTGRPPKYGTTTTVVATSLPEPIAAQLEAVRGQQSRSETVARLIGEALEARNAKPEQSSVSEREEATFKALVAARSELSILEGQMRVLHEIIAPYMPHGASKFAQIGVPKPTPPKRGQ